MNNWILCIAIGIFLTGVIKVVKNRIDTFGTQQTGPMYYYAQTSGIVQDNVYCFNYCRVQDGWRAYILEMPDLRGRSGSGAITHRLYDQGRPYICWDRPVATLKDIQAISFVWADSIQEYIATGKRFG